MRHVVYLCAMLALAAATATSSVAAPSTSSSQLTKRFKAATGMRLVPSSPQSYAGHYRAYDLGLQTATNRARYGTFTIFLVTAADVDGEVTGLLSDAHSGMLGKPAAGGIYWEQGVSLHGDPYWQAKRRYGQNVVLKWIGPSGTKRTDATWKRLHTALTVATK